MNEWEARAWEVIDVVRLREMLIKRPPDDEYWAQQIAAALEKAVIAVSIEEEDDA